MILLGLLARLLADIGELGVNVEDLRLEHSTGADVGMAELSVSPAKHDELVTGLTERGLEGRHLVVGASQCLRGGINAPIPYAKSR